MHHRPSHPPAGRRLPLDTSLLLPPSDLTATASSLGLARTLAAAALARLDQALGAACPLRRAFLHRARLDASTG